MSANLNLKADVGLKILALDLDAALAAYETRNVIVDLYDLPTGYPAQSCAIYLLYGNTIMATGTLTAATDSQLSGSLNTDTVELRTAFASLTDDLVECVLSIWDNSTKMLVACGTVDVARNYLASVEPSTATTAAWQIYEVAGVERVLFLFPDGTWRYEITILQDGIPTTSWSDPVTVTTPTAAVTPTWKVVVGGDGRQHIAYLFPDGTWRYSITIIQDGVPTTSWSDDVP
jgi:hypothetical protein